MAKIGIEAQRIFRKKKHGMDMVALELIRNLQTVDKINEYFIYVKEDEDNQVVNKYYFQNKQKKTILIYFIAPVIQLH